MVSFTTVVHCAFANSEQQMNVAIKRSDFLMILLFYSVYVLVCYCFNCGTNLIIFSLILHETSNCEELF